MNKFLHFLAKDSVLLSGIMIAVLANPFTYLVIGSFIGSVSGVDKQSAGYNSHDLFVQAMILTSSIGVLIVLISKITSWTLAYRRINAKSLDDPS